MAYTSNPHVWKARQLAVNDVLVRGLTKAAAARKYGVTRSTLCKWVKKAPKERNALIYTLPSRPHFHPNALPSEVVTRVINLRKRTKRCAPVLHAMLKAEGVTISLSSVERILRRFRLTRKKRYLVLPYAKIRRPPSDHPGALVELDTIHFTRNGLSRFYIYAAIDTYTRIGYAEYQPRLSAGVSAEVAKRVLKAFPYPVTTIQTDNGGEFGEGLYFYLSRYGVKLRHTRIRRPNDNAHVERFIRTIQEEGFNSMLPDEKTIKRKLTKFINYYNFERLHLALNCNTPYQFLSKMLT